MALLAKNTLSGDRGEMEPIQFDQAYQAKGFNVFFHVDINLFQTFLIVTRYVNLVQSHSFKVECLFGLEGGQTIVHPVDWPEEGFIFPENENQRCSSANCYTKDIAYVPSKFQIKSLMALSSNCTQKVTHTCNINDLTGVSSWIDSSGTTNSYWHGNRNSGNFQSLWS